MSLSIYHTHHSLTQGQCIVEEGEDTGASQEEDYCYWEITYCFGAFTILVHILSLRKLRGFLLYGFPEEKTVFIVSCVRLLYLLFSQLKILIMLA